MKTIILHLNRTMELDEGEVSVEVVVKMEMGMGFQNQSQVQPMLEEEKDILGIQMEEKVN